MENIDIDRFLIKIVSAEGDCPQRVLAGFVAGGDDDLCCRRDRQDLGQDRQALGSSIRIGREPEIHDRHWDRVLFDDSNGFLARARGVHLVV